MASDFTPHSNPLSVPPGCNVVLSDQEFSKSPLLQEFRIDCLRRINWRNIEGADVGRIIQSDLSQLLVNIDDLAFADFEREPYYVTPTQEGMQLILHSQLVLQYLLFAQRKVLESMGSINYQQNEANSSLDKLEQISSKQRAKIKRLMRESQALDEQAYHFEIILNRNRPDLKLVEEALKEEKPDIRTDQAKDFVMNILKATGLAPFEQENIRPEMDKHVAEAIRERERKKAQWHASIHKMAEGKFQDFQQYEPDIHSIPTPSRSFDKKDQGEQEKYHLSHFGGEMREEDQLGEIQKEGRKTVKRDQDQVRGTEKGKTLKRQDLELEKEQKRKQQEERKREAQKKEDQERRLAEIEAEKKRQEEIRREEERKEKEREKKRKEEEQKRKKDEEQKKKQREEEEEAQRQKKIKEEQAKKDKLRNEALLKKQREEEEERKRKEQAEKKRKDQEWKQQELKKKQEEQKKSSMKPGTAIGTLEGDEDEQDQEEYSQEFQDLQGTQSREKQGLKETSQEVSESKRINETPEPNMDELIKLREAMFSSHKKDLKEEIERDSSLDRTDPIAAMLLDQEEAEQSKEEIKEQPKPSIVKDQSNGLDKTVSDKLPLAPARKSPRAGPSRAVMKALDDDSIDHLQQSGDVLSQGTLNIHLEDESRNLDEITSSRQDKGPTNVLNLGQSADLGESDTFELSASHSVFPAFRPGGRPLLSALTSQGSTFGGGSSGALLLGKQKRGTRDTRSGSQKFSNYRTSYSEAPQVEEQDIH